MANQVYTRKCDQ